MGRLEPRGRRRLDSRSRFARTPGRPDVGCIDQTEFNLHIRLCRRWSEKELKSEEEEEAF